MIKNILRSQITPIPTAEQVQNIWNVVSIVINGSQVSWCRMQRTKEKRFLVDSLDQKSIVMKSRKMHFLDLLNEMVPLTSHIPEAQLCLVEEYPNTIPNSYMFAFHLHTAQIRSIALGCLASRPQPPKILAIKSVAVARLFNTCVGSERVSGQHVVDDMITWKPLPSLVFSSRIKTEFELTKAEIKEGMSNALLLNIAYWKLTNQFTDSNEV